MLVESSSSPSSPSDNRKKACIVVPNEKYRFNDEDENILDWEFSECTRSWACQKMRLVARYLDLSHSLRKLKTVHDEESVDNR